MHEVVAPDPEAGGQDTGEKRRLHLLHVANVTGVIPEIAGRRQGAVVEGREPRVMARVAVEGFLPDFAGRRGLVVGREESLDAGAHGPRTHTKER